MLPFDRPLLMWVTDRNRSDAPLPELASPASESGVDIIQIREPGLDRLPLELLVRAVKSVSRAGCQVVVNSDLEVAKKLRVGVHLPESGPTIQEARETLGADALVGRSVHSAQAARMSVGADYLVAGHVFETKSKEGSPPIGTEGLASIIAEAPAPVIAIGGIIPTRVRDVIAVGAAGVAVLSPLTRLQTVRETATAYRSALEKAMNAPETSTVAAVINGKPVELSSGTTVAAFLTVRELHERLVVVERNGEIIKRDTFAEVLIEEGDLLEIVHFVGGG